MEMDASQPIFRQLALRIEQGIVDGTYPEQTQIPSTTEFSAFLRINPATANKGINLLVESGILYKKRGIGMFVTHGARQQLLSSRREGFARQYLRPLLAEAARLEITPEDLSGMIRRAAAEDAPAADLTTTAQPTL